MSENMQLNRECGVFSAVTSAQLTFMVEFQDLCLVRNVQEDQVARQETMAVKTCCSEWFYQVFMYVYAGDERFRSFDNENVSFLCVVTVTLYRLHPRPCESCSCRCAGRMVMTSCPRSG